MIGRFILGLLGLMASRFQVEYLTVSDLLHKYFHVTSNKSLQALNAK